MWNGKTGDSRNMLPCTVCGLLQDVSCMVHVCMYVHVHVYLDALDALPVMLHVGAYVCR